MDFGIGMSGVAALVCMVNFYPGRGIFYYLIMLLCLMGCLLTSILIYFRGRKNALIGKWLWRAFHFFIGFSGAFTIALRHRAV